MDRLTCMESFVRVVERGSLTSAAEGSGLTPTMIGNHIRHLEGRLVARLLERTTRRQSLTEFGRAFYERCRHILEEVEAAEDCAAEMRKAPRGVLRVTAPVALGASVLPRLFAEYLGLFPEVEIDLSLNDRVMDLVEEGFEAAIRVGPLGDAGLVARPLAPFRVVLAAAPAYLEARGTPRTPAELAAHECLDFTFSTLRGVWRFQDGASVAVRGRLRANNGHALRAAALAALGVVLLPELLLAEDLEAGRLVQLLPKHGPAGRPMHLLTLPSRRLTPKLRTFVDFITKRLGPAQNREADSPANPDLKSETAIAIPRRGAVSKEHRNANSG